MLNVRNTSLYIALAAFAILQFSSLFAYAETVTYPNGVTSCERTGAAGLSSSVGSFSPQGGPYVPVVDYTVELNTASLLYKECVLRVIVDQQRKAAAALIVKDVGQKLLTQRNGGPMFPRYFHGDVLERGDAAMARALRSESLTTVNSSDRSLIQGAIALNYRVDTRAPSNELACPYQGNIDTIRLARDFTFDGLWAVGDPRCRPLDNYFKASELAHNNVALDREEMMYRLSTSNGLYGVESFDQNGNRVTLTPGIFTRDITSQALTSGYRMLENADDIGEVVDALFASMGDQAITHSPGGASGLSGLSGGLSGMSGYFDRVLQGQLGGLGGTINNGILATLQNLLSNEQLYNQVVTAVGQLVQKTSDDLKKYEAKCFSDTTHSQQVINTNLSPIVIDIAPKIASSTATVAGLKALITQVSGSSPPSSAQITAILTALGLHSQQQTQAEQSRLQSLQVDLTQFVQNVVSAWQSEPSAAVGCGQL
jgi:hypothetical protein